MKTSFCLVFLCFVSFVLEGYSMPRSSPVDPLEPSKETLPELEKSSVDSGNIAPEDGNLESQSSGQETPEGVVVEQDGSEGSEPGEGSSSDVDNSEESGQENQEGGESSQEEVSKTLNLLEPGVIARYVEQFMPISNELTLEETIRKVEEQLGEGGFTLEQWRAIRLPGSEDEGLPDFFFHVVDLNNDGVLTVEDDLKVHIINIFTYVDMDSNGYIDEREFLKFEKAVTLGAEMLQMLLTDEFPNEADGDS